MFLFLRKYGVEMSRAESPVSSYTCADLAASNWRRRIGGGELSHSGFNGHFARPLCILQLCILDGQAFHIFLDTVALSLPWVSPLSRCIDLHHVESRDIVD